MADPLADDEIGAAALLEWGGALGIAFYPDHSAKADLVIRMRALAAPREVHEVRCGEDALPLVERAALVLVEPDDEEATVLFFDRNRDCFEDQAARVLILLLKGGAGECALRRAPALSSFARDSSFEVRAQETLQMARASFKRSHGVDPEEWLSRWRGGELPDTLENNFALSEALDLAETS